MFDGLPVRVVWQWVGVVVIAWCEPCWSQTTTPSATVSLPQLPLRSIPRITRSIPRTASPASSDTELQLTISREDCSNADLSYHFEVDFAVITNDSELQVWAGGSDCAAQFAAPNSMSGCYLVGELDIQGLTASGDFTGAQLLGIGTTSTSRIASSCDECLPPAPGPPPNSLPVTFLLLENGTLRASATHQMYYALVGPWVPKDPRAEADQQSLYLTWNLNLSGHAHHFHFYCAENRNALGGCTSNELEPYTETAMRQARDAQDPDRFYSSWICGQSPPASMLCGQTLGESMHGLTDANQMDGKSCAVAVASVDAYGNVGPLTDPVCATPDARALTHRFPPTFEGYALTSNSSGCSLGRLRRVRKTSQLLLLLGILSSLRRAKYKSSATVEYG